HKVVIRRGQLKTTYTQVQQTTYNFNNKSDAEQTLFLDHPRPDADWTLFETAEPKEITENYWRFQLVLAPRKVTSCVVRQRQTLHQNYTLRDVGDSQLALWLEQRYLDAETGRLLRQVMTLRQQAASIEDRIKELEKERGAIQTVEQP